MAPIGEGKAIEIGFSSYSGGDFLLFYAALLLAAVVAGLWIPAFLRPDGRNAGPVGSEALAYLAGGASRFAESVTASLLGRDQLRAERKKLVRMPRAEGRTRAEQALLRSGAELRWKGARYMLGAHADALDRELSAKGLLIAPAERTTFRIIPVLPYIVLLLLGAFRWQAGYAQGEPVGFLTLLMVATAALAVIRFVRFNPRTRAGEELLAETQRASERLRSATPADEAGRAVALFGTGVLVGTPWASLHQMRSQTSAGGCGGGGGHDGGGDGGGCGGGGCGGCGG